jgi:hypothetical protein
VSQDQESFLSRWSRRKHEASREEAAEPAPGPAPGADATQQQAAEAAAPADALIAAASPQAELPAELPPELPPLDSLDGLRSDYQAFLQATVDEDTRRSALKKLFGDPHFNQMDGLDVYVDDYTQFEPMPAAMRLTLNHAREFLLDSERLALGLGPTHGPPLTPPDAAPQAATPAAPGSAAPADGLTAEAEAPDALAATAANADAAQISTIGGTTEAQPRTDETLATDVTAADGGAPAQPSPASVRDSAARGAAPPPATV